MTHVRRHYENEVDLQKSYGGDPNLFSIEFHHGGYFKTFPGRKYFKGKTDYIDLVDIDRFCVHDLDDVLEELGYDHNVKRYYHFLTLGSDLDFGLQALGNDNDVRIMAHYVCDHKLILVYTEIAKTNLHTYFTSPSKVVIKEIDSSEANEPRQQNPSGLRLMLEWSHVEGSSGNTQGVEPIDDTIVEPIDDNNVQPIDDTNVPTVETVHQSTVPTVETNYPTQESLPLDFDELFNFNPFMDDPSVVQQENPSVEVEDIQMQNNSDENSDASSEDSDYIVDTDNMDDDVVVDMSNFQLHTDKDVENETSFESGLHDTDDTDVGHNAEFDSGSGSDADVQPESARMKVINSISKKQKTVADKKHMKHCFYIGQFFATKNDIKDMVRDVAVESRRELRIIKNDKTRVRVACGGQMPQFQKNLSTVGSTSDALGRKKGGGSKQKDEGPYLKNRGGRGKRTNPNKTTCPWVLLISKEVNSETWIVKTFIDDHTFLQSRKIKACSSKYLSRHVIEHMEGNPNIPTKALQDQLQRKLEVGITTNQVFKARMKARGQLLEDYTQQYLRLRDYMQELLTTNPGTTVKLEVETPTNQESDTRVFKRIYVCLGELKKGFKATGRDLLGLDGAFMKGPFPGQVLTAVGVDSNNGIYPVSYAIVEAENISTWTWFLECLAEDSDLEINSNFTFISDKQKGIIQAVESVFPCAEHRYCLRHIHENMKLRWRGQAYKDLLWKCATATTVQQFHKAMDNFKQFNQEAHLWLSKIPPQHWTRSHFSGRSHSDVLLNNICEVFNRQLVDGRDKPILTALEFIRKYIMKRIVKVLGNIDKTEGSLTPNAVKLLEANKTEASKYKVHWNGGDKYQVSGPWGDQCVVDVKEMVCTCRRWELNGIPCKHAVATNWNMTLNGIQVPPPEGWVNAIYWVDTWKKVYSYKVNPINGMPMWTKTNVPTKLLPPKHHAQVGRPKKKRIRAATEGDDAETRLSKKGVTMTCKKCGGQGHNKRGCKVTGSTSSSAT